MILQSTRVIALCTLAAMATSVHGQSCSDFRWSALPSDDGIGLPTECNGGPSALAIFDAGDGPKLYITLENGCGDGGNELGSWDGATLERVPSPILNTSKKMLVVNDVLYVATSSTLWSWDGATWALIFPCEQSTGADRINDIFVFESDKGNQLIAEGFFQSCLGEQLEDNYSRLCKLEKDGSWTPLEPQDTLTSDYEIGGGCTIQTDQGPRFLMSGNFNEHSANSKTITSYCLAIYDGADMHLLGQNAQGLVANSLTMSNGMYLKNGSPTQQVMITKTNGTFVDFTSPILLNEPERLLQDPEYASTLFSEAWTPMGSGVSDDINAHCSLQLEERTIDFFAGEFARAGKHDVQGFAQWDDNGWSSTGADFFPRDIRSTIVFDDGDGPGVYVVGRMIVEGATIVNGIAKYSAAGPPIIKLSPETTNTTQGSPTSFSVDANGLELSYQWFKDDIPLDDEGDDVIGSADAELILTNPQFEDTGSYSVRVFNPCGDAFSQAAELIVTVPGDLNYDGSVSGDDLAIMLAFWGPCPPSGLPCPADINGDLVIDGQDLATLLSVWSF